MRASFRRSRFEVLRGLTHSIPSAVSAGGEDVATPSSFSRTRELGHRRSARDGADVAELIGGNPGLTQLCRVAPG